MHGGGALHPTVKNVSNFFLISIVVNNSNLMRTVVINNRTGPGLVKRVILFLLTCNFIRLAYKVSPCQFYSLSGTEIWSEL